MLGSAAVTNPDHATETLRPRLGLEQVTKATALVVTAIYGSGFLTVTLHHSEFGIFEFDFLKARVLSAGVLFILLTAAPALAAARVFRLLGLSRKPGPSPIHIAPENERYLNVSWGMDLWFTCVYLAYFSQYLTGSMDVPKPWGLTLFCIFGILVLVAAAAQRTRFNRYPKRCLLLEFLLAGCVFAIYFVYWRHFLILLTAWYYAVGLTGVWFYRVVMDPERRSRTEWEWIVFSWITFVGLYSTLIYARVEPKFGGGKPTPIILYFSGTNPISSSQSMPASLVDETDHGYYVLLNANEPKALFLRRDLVSAVYYGATAPAKR